MNHPLPHAALDAPTPARRRAPRPCRPASANASSTSPGVCDRHGARSSPCAFPPAAPGGVVFAHTARKWPGWPPGHTNAHRVPLIAAYGAGSSLEGHLLAVAGGISLDAVADEPGAAGTGRGTSTMTVQPGVTTKHSSIRKSRTARPVLPDPTGRRCLAGRHVRPHRGIPRGPMRCATAPCAEERCWR
ncbi:hypothetical protein ACU4GD_35690 [Cupriavidus basilensis]